MRGRAATGDLPPRPIAATLIGLTTPMQDSIGLLLLITPRFNPRVRSADTSFPLETLP